ncbi:uroporphyrinogen decarboxylase family protein [Desulfobacula sp.]
MKSEMTSKERFLAAVNQQEVDYMPTCGPFQALWAMGESKLTVAESIENPKLAAQSQVKPIQDCDFDGLEVMWDWLSPAGTLGCNIKFPELGAPITMSHILDDHTDLSKLQIPDFNQDHRFKSSVQTARILIEQFSKERYLYCTAVAPFTLAGEIRGVEKLMRDCFKKKEFVKELLEFTTAVLTGYYTQIATLDVDGIFICDPTASGSLMSRKLFDKFSKPYIKTIVDVIKKAGKHAIVHICGDITDRLESVAEIEPDILSVDTHVDLEFAKSIFGGKIATLGNINVVNTLYMGTQQEVNDQILTILKKTGGKGHILGGACDIAPESPKELVANWKKALV